MSVMDGKIVGVLAYAEACYDDCEFLLHHDSGCDDHSGRVQGKGNGESPWNYQGVDEVMLALLYKQYEAPLLSCLDRS